MAFRCTPEEHKLICEMAAWSGMNRQDYIIAKLTDTQVEVKPSVSVQKALRDSMAELAKEVRLAASYGELSESLQQRVELVMGFFLALGEPVDAPSARGIATSRAFGGADGNRHGCRLRHRKHLRDGTQVGPNARPPTPCPQAIRRDRRYRPRPKTPSPGRRPWSQGRQRRGQGRPCIPFPASWWTNRHRGWRR